MAEKCGQCGSTRIQSRAWVDYNTAEFDEWCDDGDVWCNDCEEFADIEENNDI